MLAITTVGLDIAKSVFQVRGVDDARILDLAFDCVDVCSWPCTDVES